MFGGLGDAVPDEGCAPRRHGHLRRYRTVTADSRPAGPLLSLVDRLILPALGAIYGSPEPNLALELQAANGVRTRDLKLGKLALYQLSYRRTGSDTTPLPLILGVVRRRALPIFISVVAAALIGLLIYGISHQAASRTLDDLVAHGQQPLAPQAADKLPILGGDGRSSLAALKGKVVVLNFWASWCEPCQIEAPLLERAQSKLEAHDATVLGVAYLDAAPDSKSFVRRFHLTYPNLRDNDGAFAHSYGTDQLPESFVIDRQGHIVAISRGQIEQPFLNRAIALAESS
jgi:cytochrome c biogenesis protein CcmG/thiol:disulfide interchange protein DsbE